MAQAEGASRVLFDEPGPRGRRMIAAWSVIVGVLIAAAVGTAVWQFGRAGQLEAERWQFFLYPAIIRFLGQGVGGTFLTTGVAAVVAFPFGLLLALGRLSRNRVLSAVATGWIEFFRSIPMLLVVYAFLLAFPSFGINLPVFWKLVVPMILVSSGTTAEVFRAGIRAVDRGQYEAANSLGMTDGQMMRLVVLPQSFRIVLPNLLTQLVSLLKDSTLGYVVSFAELMQQGRLLTSYYHYLIQTYLVIAVIYVVMNYLLTRLAEYLQARGSRRAVQRPAGVRVAMGTMA